MRSQSQTRNVKVNYNYFEVQPWCSCDLLWKWVWHHWPPHLSLAGVFRYIICPFLSGIKGHHVTFDLPCKKVVHVIFRYKTKEHTKTHVQKHNPILPLIIITFLQMQPLMRRSWLSSLDRRKTDSKHLCNIFKSSQTLKCL